MGVLVVPALAGGPGHSCLTAGHRCPACTMVARATRLASRPGEEVSSPGAPPLLWCWNVRGVDQPLSAVDRAGVAVVVGALVEQGPVAVVEVAGVLVVVPDVPGPSLVPIGRGVGALAGVDL